MAAGAALWSQYAHFLGGGQGDHAVFLRCSAIFARHDLAVAIERREPWRHDVPVLDLVQAHAQHPGHHHAGQVGRFVALPYLIPCAVLPAHLGLQLQKEALGQPTVRV